MLFPLTSDLLNDGVRRQTLLADLAETEEVRMVHLALEQLYRTQLVALELGVRLAVCDDVDAADSP